jgi:hypothetical protein
MTNEFCEYEDAVAAALQRGQMDGSLRGHLRVCPHCAELQLIWQYFESAAPLADEFRPLPAPGLIWWRAQLAERREQAQRAVAAIELMQKLAIGVTLIALVTFALLWGRDISPVYPNTSLIGAGMFLANAVVLYGWARGRI